MKKILFVLLGAASAWAQGTQSAVLNGTSQGYVVTLPATAPWNSLGSNRVEFRISNFTLAPASQQDQFTYAGAIIGFIGAGSNALSVTDFNNGSVTSTVCMLEPGYTGNCVSGTARTDVLVRWTMIAGKGEIIEIWDADGSNYAAACTMVLSCNAVSATPANYDAPVTVGWTGSANFFAGRFAYFRWYSSTVPVGPDAALPPNNVAGGDLLDLEFEGNGNDSSAHANNAVASGSPTYTTTAYHGYLPFDFSNQSGAAFTIDGSGSGANTYAWTQTGGTACTLTNSTSSVVTISGCSGFGMRTFQLVATSAAVQTSTVTVNVGIVPTDSRGVVQVADANWAWMLGPLAMFQQGGATQSPWSWFENQRVYLSNYWYSSSTTAPGGAWPTSMAGAEENILYYCSICSLYREYYRTGLTYYQTWARNLASTAYAYSDGWNSGGPVSAAVYCGGSNSCPGLNDATSGGIYNNSPTISSGSYHIVIDGTGTPNTFKWQFNGGAFTTGVAVTGAAQTLSNAVTIKFAATTGHTLNDTWDITVGCGGNFTAPRDSTAEGIIMWLYDTSGDLTATGCAQQYVDWEFNNYLEQRDITQGYAGPFTGTRESGYAYNMGVELSVVSNVNVASHGLWTVRVPNEFTNYWKPYQCPSNYNVGCGTLTTQIAGTVAINGTTTVVGTGTSFTTAFTPGVSRVVISNGGTGYTSAPTVTSSFFTGAALTATVSGGAVTAITINTPGAPINDPNPVHDLTFSGGGGSGAAGFSIAGNIWIDDSATLCSVNGIDAGWNGLGRVIASITDNFHLTLVATSKPSQTASGCIGFVDSVGAANDAGSVRWSDQWPGYMEQPWHIAIGAEGIARLLYHPSISAPAGTLTYLQNLGTELGVQEYLNLSCQGVTVRSVFYAQYAAGPYGNGCSTVADLQGSRAQENTVFHIFGSLYRATGSSTWLTYGDNYFSADFGDSGTGSGTDGFIGQFMVANGSKFYGQSLRSADSYLTNRLAPLSVSAGSVYGAGTIFPAAGVH